MGRKWAYNDFVVCPVEVAMGDSLQFRLRPPGENSTHGNGATTASLGNRVLFLGEVLSLEPQGMSG